MSVRRARFAFFDRPSVLGRAGRGWTAWLPAAVLAALPALSLYGPKALPGLVVILIAPALWLCLRERAARPRPPWRIMAALVGFVGLGAASALWSIDPTASLTAAAKLAGWAVAATMLFVLWPSVAGRDAGLAERALIGGFAGALILLAVDLNTDLAVLRLVQVRAKAGTEFYAYSLNRGATVLALLLCPVGALCLIRWRAWTAWLAFAAGVAAISLSISTAALLAAILGGITFALVRWLGRPIIYAMAAVMAAWLVAAPLVLGPLATSPWLAGLMPQMAPANYHRLLIWEFAAGRIAERPMLGWGLDSARSVPGGRQNLSARLAERAAPPDDEPQKQDLRSMVFEALPLHPHSLALQIWLELGAAGALLAAALIGGAVGAVAAAPSRTGRASLAGTAAAGFVIANLSYGAWQSWWVAALILALAINLALVREPAAAPAQT
jgi:O-antigen ligase